MFLLYLLFKQNIRPRKGENEALMEELMSSFSIGGKKKKKYKANRKSAAEGKGPQDGLKETGSSVQRK